MKYKNIYSAIHNFGDSFVSSMNYVDGDYVFDEIDRIHSGGHEITIDWLKMSFEPKSKATPRILKSLGYYRVGMEDHFNSQNVEFDRLAMLRFRWCVGSRKFMEAIDNRGKYYKIYLREDK